MMKMNVLSFRLYYAPVGAEFDENDDDDDDDDDDDNDVLSSKMVYVYTVYWCSLK